MLSKNLTRRLSHCACLLISWNPLMSSLAQIPSPSNAGQNSGNNGFGSATTSVGTPVFSQGLVSVVSGLEISPDGTISTSPDRMALVQDAITSTASTADVQIIAPLLAYAGSSSSESGPLSVNTLSPNYLTIPVILRQANQSPTGYIASASSDLYIEYSAPPQGTQGFTPGRSIPSFQTQGSSSLQAYTQSLVDQLVATGLSRSLASQLISLMQGLATQSSLTQLNRAINIHNQISISSPPAIRDALSVQPVFIACTRILRAARVALDVSL